MWIDKHFMLFLNKGSEGFIYLVPISKVHPKGQIGLVERLAQCAHGKRWHRGIAAKQEIQV